MNKLCGILAVALSILLFNSCSEDMFSYSRNEDEKILPHIRYNNLSGSYLSGQLALLRNDYDAAAKYLSKAYDYDNDNKELLSRLYIIHSANGDIEKAAKYAKLSEENGDKSSSVQIIKIVDNMSKSEYDEAVKNAEKISSEIKIMVEPVIKTWAYAGLNRKEDAFAELEKLRLDKNGKKVDEHDYYIYNKAMLYEYFGDIQDAKTEYEKLIKMSGKDLSFYNYSAIIEFYIRNGFNEDAQKLAKRVRYSGYIKDAKDEYTKRLLSGEDSVQYHKVSPQVAISDMMIYISAWINQLGGNPEMTYFYMRMAGYVNPQNMFLQYIIAMHMDFFGMHNEALKYYKKITEPSYIRYASQLKIADIYIVQDEYEKAEDLLKKLHKEYPDKEDLQLKLGDVLRISRKNEEAYNYYNLLLKKYPEKYKNDWSIHYALGSVCSDAGNYDEAEKHLAKALELSKDNYIILNHLGYIWLENDKNTTEAFEYIAKALSKEPYKAHIIDSMGWAFFKIGDTKRAVKYLEAAVGMESGSALMNEHLGDAYWADGRKNEAIFQWNHAMTLKKDAEEVNKEKLQEKIENGLVDYKPISNYNFMQVRKIIKDYKL